MEKLNVIKTQEAQAGQSTELRPHLSILRVVIKREYFNQIISGEKKEEYRKLSDYWASRLVNRKYDFVEFINGYKKDAPRALVEYNGYEIKEIRHPFFGNEPVRVFAIKLGGILSNN